MELVWNDSRETGLREILLKKKVSFHCPVSVHFTIYLLVKKIMNGIHSLYVFLPAYACTCVHICVYAQAHITYKCYHVGQIRGGGLFITDEDEV